MSEPRKDAASRRDFLKGAVMSVPAVAVAATAVPQEAVAEKAAPHGRIQDTAHIRAYYDSARF